ncbi:MAG: ROK family protein, partial [Mariprofundaceae bacterium]|nr:ROK family protein [Mariprofundaceae bacterium]
MHKKHVLAADVGGTNIRAAWVDGLGNMGDERRIQADLSRDDVCEDDVMHILTDFLHAYLSDYPDIQAVGLGFPGFFLGDTGVLLASPNLPQLKNVALAKKLSEQLSLPVCVQNDALCAALGEHRFGAGKNTDNLLHITLGTGVGGGLILQQQAYTGESGMAMEFGHVRVQTQAAARSCGCGGLGCVEAYASSTAIQTIYAELTGETLMTKAIYQRACEGDAVARGVFERAGGYLGQAIAEAVKLLDIHTVTISGGLIGAWDILHPPLMTALNQHVISP